MNFKVTLALASSLLAFNSFAQCLGEICVGETVLDSYNTVTTVVGIDDVRKEVIVRTSSGYKNVPPSGLSDEVPSTIYPQGQIVLDEYNYIGSVTNVFRNGQIAYKKNGYSTLSFSKNLSVKVDTIKGLKEGTRIIDDYNYRGSVTQMYSNGIVFYKKDGYSAETSTTSKLVMRVEAFGHLKLKSEIIDSYNYRGQVTDLYADGRIFYKKDGYSAETVTSSSKDLILRVNVYGSLEKETRIIDEYNYRGQVTDLYADGRIFYKKDGYSAETVTGSAKSLVLQVGTYGGLEKGTAIIDTYNYAGVITDLYQDGRIFYKKEGYSAESVTNSSSLSRETTAFKEYKVGQRAIDDYNYLGTIQRLFENGVIFFKKDGYSSTSTVSKLHLEVPTSTKYSKDSFYANDSKVVAKPTAFFSNGSVLHGNSVQSEIYPKVETYEELVSGDEIASLDGKIYKITELYSNGVLVVDKGDEKTQNQKLVKMDDFSDDDRMIRDIALTIHYHLTAKTEINTVAFKVEEISLIKEKVLAKINQTEMWELDKKAKKAVVDYLTSLAFPNDSNIVEAEEYALSVTPASMIDEVKSVLDGEQKKYNIVSPEAAKSARKSIVFNIDKGLLKTTCYVTIKERNIVVKKIDKKINKRDTDACLKELKD